MNNDQIPEENQPGLNFVINKFFTLKIDSKSE